MKYILEYKLRENRPARMAFKEPDGDGNQTLIWVINPAGKKSLVTKTSARDHWNELIKQGWRRVE